MAPPTGPYLKLRSFSSKPRTRYARVHQYLDGVLFTTIICVALFMEARCGVSGDASLAKPYNHYILNYNNKRAKSRTLAWGHVETTDGSLRTMIRQELKTCEPFWPLSRAGCGIRYGFVIWSERERREVGRAQTGSQTRVAVRMAEFGRAPPMSARH